MTNATIRMARRIVRARFENSAKTKRDWVIYVRDVEYLRDEERAREALYL